MAFFERVCGYQDNGQLMNSDLGNDSLYLPIDRVLSALELILTDVETLANVKTKLGLRNTVDASGKSDTGDLDDWIALAPNDVLVVDRSAKRSLYLIKLKACVYIQNGVVGGAGWAGLSTPNDVRSKLGITQATYP